MARHRAVGTSCSLIIPVLPRRPSRKFTDESIETDRKLGQQYRFPVHEDVHIAESSLRLQRTAPASHPSPFPTASRDRLAN